MRPTFGRASRLASARRHRYDSAGPAPDVAAALEQPLPDNAIERALREVTGVAAGPIPPGLRERVTELHVCGHWLRDLAPLAGLPRLERLWVRSRAACDLGPLAQLGRLKELTLLELPARDLAPLAGLERLECLRLESLGDGATIDLGPLAGLSRLRDLCLRRTRPERVAPLAHLRRLRELELAQAGAPPDLAALAAIEPLRYLNVHGTQVSAEARELLVARAQHHELCLEGLPDAATLRERDPEPERPLLDAAGASALCARLAERALRWPCAVRALLTDAAEVALPPLPWPLGPRATLAQALERLWSPLEQRAPGFRRALAERTVALAVLQPLGDDEPLLGYLVRRAASASEGAYALLLGRAPRRDERAASPCFRVPLALAELYSVHAGLEAEGAQLLAPEALGPLEPLLGGQLDAFRKHNRGVDPDELRVFLREPDGGAQLLDLDRLDARGDPIVRRFYAETVEVDGQSTFWDWFEDEAPALFLHAGP